ncbi:hypothetical protein B6D60_09285 [candidate division KSB1 bacterium 4484_87]|nr:MAG: hypothetical protein B6D60_09285 [candidate division KSB1 bacterium 4484_87]
MEEDGKKSVNDDAFDDEKIPEFIYVTDVLDLHGFFPEQAEEVVSEFLDQAVELQLPQVRIIHGKGRSKMKWTVQQILKTHPVVLSFYDAPPEFGGWGATIVEIKLP